MASPRPINRSVVRHLDTGYFNDARDWLTFETLRLGKPKLAELVGPRILASALSEKIGPLSSCAWKRLEAHAEAIVFLAMGMDINVGRETLYLDPQLERMPEMFETRFFIRTMDMMALPVGTLLENETFTVDERYPSYFAKFS